MYYKLLGRLPEQTIEIFVKEIYKLKKSIPYQWIRVNDFLHNEFLKIFSHDTLEVQINPATNNYVQKAAYAEPNFGYRIHKDGVKCKSALNICLSSNESDWIRWYDDDYINSISLMTLDTKKVIASRDTDIFDYENIPYVAELRTQPGEVYVIDVDTFHSFKCNGPKNFITLQTKFKNFPDFETLSALVSPTNFTCLESY